MSNSQRWNQSTDTVREEEPVPKTGGSERTTVACKVTREQREALELLVEVRHLGAENLHQLLHKLAVEPAVTEAARIRRVANPMEEVTRGNP
jgi:hypothetical protein